MYKCPVADDESTFLLLDTEIYKQPDFLRLWVILRERNAVQRKGYRLVFGEDLNGSEARKGASGFLAAYLQIDRDQRYPEGPHQTSYGDTVDYPVWWLIEHVYRWQDKKNNEKRAGAVERIR